LNNQTAHVYQTYSDSFSKYLFGQFFKIFLLMFQMHNIFVASGKTTEIAFHNASFCHSRIPLDYTKAVFETLRSTKSSLPGAIILRPWLWSLLQLLDNNTRALEQMFRLLYDNYMGYMHWIIELDGGYN